MHTILLKIVQKIGDCSTGDIIKELKGTRDKRIYSALDAYAKNGMLFKKQPDGKAKNVWVLTQKGIDIIAEREAGEGILSLAEYTKALNDYRKKHPHVNKNKKAKSAQKDLLAPEQKPKKELDPDIGPMTTAATAAVDGIAALVEENQRNTALLKNIYNQLNAVFGNQK